MWGSKKTILLCFDHLDNEGAKLFEEQLTEVKRYYSFAKLSDVVSDLQRGKVRNVASVLLLNARKSAMLRAVPVLRDFEIPFTLFLRPDCIGLNRLPSEESFKSDSIETLDPTRFFATWGDLRQLPPTIWEPGFVISDDCASVQTAQDLAFTRTQLSREVTLAFSSGVCDVAVLKSLGVHALVTNHAGAVTKTTDVYALPQWRLVEEEDKQNKSEG